MSVCGGFRTVSTGNTALYYNIVSDTNQYASDIGITADKCYLMSLYTCTFDVFSVQYTLYNDITNEVVASGTGDYNNANIDIFNNSYRLVVSVEY